MGEVVVARLVLSILPKMPNPCQLDRFSGVVLDLDRHRASCRAGLSGPMVKRVTEELAVAGFEAVNRVTMGGSPGAGHEDQSVPSEQSKR